MTFTVYMYVEKLHHFFQTYLQRLRQMIRGDRPEYTPRGGFTLRNFLNHLVKFSVNVYDRASLLFYPARAMDHKEDGRKLSETKYNAGNLYTMTEIVYPENNCNSYNETVSKSGSQQQNGSTNGAIKLPQNELHGEEKYLSNGCVEYREGETLSSNSNLDNKQQSSKTIPVKNMNHDTMT